MPDIESLSVETGGPIQLSKGAAQHAWQRSWTQAWDAVRANCAWLKPLSSNILCLGFAAQLWKVYTHDVPQVKYLLRKEQQLAQGSEGEGCVRCEDCSGGCLLPELDSTGWATTLRCYVSVQALRSVSIFRAALKDRMLQFWFKFWSGLGLLLLPYPPACHAMPNSSKHPRKTVSHTREDSEKS